jgi:hypothetical protein
MSAHLKLVTDAGQLLVLHNPEHIKNKFWRKTENTRIYHPPGKSDIFSNTGYLIHEYTTKSINEDITIGSTTAASTEIKSIFGNINEPKSAIADITQPER